MESATPRPAIKPEANPARKLQGLARSMAPKRTLKIVPRPPAAARNAPRDSSFSGFIKSSDLMD
jgi:hypothetical protein